VAEPDLDLRADEVTVLAEAAKVADTIAMLEADFVGQPSTVPGSKGQVILHPLVTELRQQRTLLASLMTKLDLPEVDSSENPWDHLTASQRARKAAHARWRH